MHNLTNYRFGLRTYVIIIMRFKVKALWWLYVLQSLNIMLFKDVKFCEGFVDNLHFFNCDKYAFSAAML